MDRLTILRMLSEHAKRLSKAQVAHDIESKVAAPLRDVLGLGPAFVGFRQITIAHAAHRLRQFLNILSDVHEHVVLDAAQSSVGEGMAHDAALARVGVAVQRGVRAERSGDGGEGEVEV